MTSPAAAKLGDSQGTRGSHMSTSATKSMQTAGTGGRKASSPSSPPVKGPKTSESAELQGGSAGAHRAVFQVLRDDAKQSQRQVPGASLHPGAGQEAPSLPWLAAWPHQSPMWGREHGPAHALTRAPLFRAAAAPRK